MASTPERKADPGHVRGNRWSVCFEPTLVFSRSTAILAGRMGLRGLAWLVLG